MKFDPAKFINRVPWLRVTLYDTPTSISHPWGSGRNPGRSMLRESPRSVVCRSNCSLNFCHSRTSGLDTLFFVGHPFLDVVPKANSDCGEKSMREILSTQPSDEVAATSSVLTF